MAIAGGMLRPDERVGRDGVEIGVVVGWKRSQFDQLAFQNRLQVEGLSGALLRAVDFQSSSRGGRPTRSFYKLKSGSQPVGSAKRLPRPAAARQATSCPR